MTTQELLPPQPKSRPRERARHGRDADFLDSMAKKVFETLAAGKRKRIVPIDVPPGWADDFVAEIRAERDSSL